MRWINPLALRKCGVLGMNKRNVAYIGRYNARRKFPLVDDKLQTKLIVAEAGLRVPKLVHTLTTHHEVRQASVLLEGLDEFVIKPSRGSGGKGIVVVVGRDENGFIKKSGARMSMADMERHVSNVIGGLYSLGGRTDVAIIESMVAVDPFFDGLSFEGLPDIRIISFLGYPVMGMLRLPTRESDGKANLHGGAVGVGLDIATGCAVAAVQHNRRVHQHPDTGRRLDDIEIPGWNELLVLAARCYEVTGLGYLGIDLVLGKDEGPVLLELNARPGLSIQIANGEGLLPRLRHIESLTARDPSARGRVAHAIENFAHAER